MRTRKHWRLGIIISKLVKNTLYSNVNVFSARFTWSSELPEGLAVCRAKVILHLCSSVILRPWVWYGPRKLFKHSYELMPRSKNNRKSNSAVSRNRFTGHPRCGEFDDWVSNNWLLSSARKTLAHCHRIWNRKMLIWWFYAMLIFQLTSVFKKTYSSGPNDFSTLKCFLHFFVGLFSLCCLQKYLKHCMQKVSLEFQSCSSSLSSSCCCSFFYSHKQSHLNLENYKAQRKIFNWKKIRIF